MKNVIITGIIIFLLVISLSGCTNQQESSNDDKTNKKDYIKISTRKSDRKGMACNSLNYELSGICRWLTVHLSRKGGSTSHIQPGYCSLPIQSW